MKANSLRLAIGAALMTTLAACAAPPAPAPVQAPPPPPPAPPPPPPPAPRVTANWRDMPVTPGTWSWIVVGGMSRANFAGGLLSLACDKPNALVVIALRGETAGTVPLTVHTTSQRRVLTAQPYAGPPAIVAASLAAHDDLLDAMAFSRGRIAVEAVGIAPVYAPSWPEIGRVIEDCR